MTPGSGFSLYISSGFGVRVHILIAPETGPRDHTLKGFLLHRCSRLEAVQVRTRAGAAGDVSLGSEIQDLRNQRFRGYKLFFWGVTIPVSGQ